MSWQKAKRIRARVVKKRVGSKDKHVALVKATSGARTKKHQRKVDRRKRLDAKEAEALEAAMEIEVVVPAKKKKAAAKKGAPMKKVAAKKAAKGSKGPEAMQD